MKMEGHIKISYPFLGRDNNNLLAKYQLCKIILHIYYAKKLESSAQKKQVKSFCLEGKILSYP